MNNETQATLRRLKAAAGGLENMDLTDLEAPDVDSAFDVGEIASEVAENLDIEAAVESALIDKATELRRDLEGFKDTVEQSVSDAEDAINAANYALDEAITAIEDLCVKVEELETQLAASLSIAPELREPLLTFLAAMALTILPKAEAVEVVAELVTPSPEVV